MTSEQIELFERYSANTLTSQEQSAMEEQLLADPDFKQEYEAFLLVQDSVIHHNNDRLKNKIASVLDQEEDRAAPNRWRFLYAAASIVALCLLAAYFFWPTSPTAGLYAEYYQPYSETTTVLSETTDDLSDCLNAYNQKKYAEALPCLNALPPTADHLFYTGMCYANLDQTSPAIEALLQVEELNASFLEETNWYLALLYLKQENVEQTKERLQRILNDSSSYKEQSSRNMLDALENR